MARQFPDRAFKIAADIERKGTPLYDRTTAYLVDKSGTIRQIFPMVIHVRPSWGAFLSEIDRIDEGDTQRKTEPEALEPTTDAPR